MIFLILILQSHCKKQLLRGKVIKALIIIIIILCMCALKRKKKSELRPRYDDKQANHAPQDKNWI